MFSLVVIFPVWFCSNSDTHTFLPEVDVDSKVKETGKFSKCTKFEGSNLKNDIVNAKNAAINH